MTTARTSRDLGGIPAAAELVVLLDEAGRAVGSAPKATVHGADTPLHLAFSMYGFDEAGRLLLTRRAAVKRTFPLVWTNTVCGHPAPGEALPTAIARRAHDELGVELDGIRLVLPTFRYRATMLGVVEHEVCPVFVARVLGTPDVDPDEVGGVERVAWPAFADAVVTGVREVSPWCALQVPELLTLGPDPGSWPAANPRLLPPAASLA